MGRDVAWSCDLPASFCKCSLIGKRPAIASISFVRKVLNAPSIQMAALSPRALSKYDKGAQL